VATDLSENGGRSIPHAYALLGAGDVVCVLHVLKPGEDRGPILAQLRGVVPSEGADRGICTEVEVTEDRDTARGICEAADRFDADVVCIGSHGRSGLLGLAMGSVAHDVIARSNRPVLIVRPPSS
jgi:nucleotide-binding universal stress UspA family protein